MAKSAGEKRFSTLISSMYNATKDFVPGRRFLKKDFLAFFFTWVPDFSDRFNKLSDKSKTAYSNYVTGSAGKLAKFKVIEGGDYNIDREGRRLDVFAGVYDKCQRDTARAAIREFYHNHDSAMKKIIEAALSSILELSKPDPALSYEDNMSRSSEREKFSKAYTYFKLRMENGIDPADILGELSWYTISGHYNYPATERPAPNVYIASKKVIENETEVYNLDDRCKDADHLLVIAFGATSFLAGRIVSKNTYAAKWTNFFQKLSSKRASIDFVILEPGSPAEIDAVKFKMRPLTLNSDIAVSEIVSKNMEVLRNEIDRSELTNVHLYSTQIALPVSYVIAEFDDNHDRDSLKCDLYLPILNDYVEKDGEKRLKDERYFDATVRQSFVLYRNDPNTHELYEMLLHNAYSILNSAKKVL